MFTSGKKLIDSHGREINYLRLSITDRCNLNCIYCQPLKRVSLLENDEILSFEEMLRLISIMSGLGVKKVRITGGEPLLRKDLLDLLSSIRKIPGIDDLVLTTNGLLLKDAVSELEHISIDGINISLDTLDRDKFTDITGVDALHSVQTSIEAVLDSSIRPLKINVVVMGGVNDDEIEDFVELAKNEPIEVRFIEYMPLADPGRLIGFISGGIMRSFIEYKMIPVTMNNGRTARCFDIPGFKGRIGFITPISDRFCTSCTRIRLSADGMLRTCLMSDYVFALKDRIRRGDDDESIAKLINESLINKGERCKLDDKLCGNIKMSSIGG